MYFQLSKDYSNNFPKFYDIKNFKLSTDLGWHETQGRFGKLIFKGYAYTNLKDFLEKHDPETIHNHHGSFTAIMEKGNKIFVVHDTNREFPLFIDDDNTTVTNLTRNDKTKYPDVSLQIDCDQNKIKESYQEHEFEKKDDVSMSTTAEVVLGILNNDIRAFADMYKNPIKVVPTGGIDSTLLISLLKHNNVEFEVIDYEHKKWTYFYKKNRQAVNANINEGVFTSVGHTWGEEPMTLANGWHADQQFFRCYLPLAVFCKAKTINLTDELEKHKEAYSYYFLLNEISERETQLSATLHDVTDSRSAYKRIFEIIRASFQPWSFENTLYWSPFKNLNITKNVLQMCDADILENSFDASLQKMILNKIDPNLLDVITPKKNQFDQTVYEKFTNTLMKY